MSGRLASLYRHPVKGFTPERLPRATLGPGAHFPCDRMYAVENGPSGFDPAKPAHLHKSKFTVLAQIPDVARARTSFDETRGIFNVEAEGHGSLAADLTRREGREALAAWLTGVLGEAVRGPLRVMSAPPHRFMDDVKGCVSLINLESVRDFAARAGRPIDPLRFRANLYVEGLPAWSEFDIIGGQVSVGGVRAEVIKAIVRCAATHVDPATAERDFELVPALHEHYGHVLCGVYLNVLNGGEVVEGDAVTFGDPT
ncbi:MAG: MOSC domain-containing protein [Caulobacteraceae bacterium]